MRPTDFIDLLQQPIEDVLDADLVRSIGEAGVMERVDTFTFVKFQHAGISMDFGTDSRLCAIFFDCEVAQQEEATGISADATQRSLRQLLGRPSRSGAAQSLPIIGRKGAWDRWDYAERSLHVQYASDRDRVTMVTLMHPLAVPPAHSAP